MIPPLPDPEDPATQVPWPTRRRASDDTVIQEVDRGLHDESPGRPVTERPKPPAALPVKKRLTTWNLITLSISMAGAQIAWTVELGYGTPFLLGLGLSEQLTSLVWLAGPISGLIAQPVIGAISDSSPSKWRRRYWVILSTVALIISTLVLAYCRELAALIVDLFQVGSGDWDEKRIRWVANAAIWLAIVSFYVLDFALNALQASLRNLLLDVAPAAQLNSGNAWHGRMTNAGNIIGYGFGFLPLAQLPILRLIGGSQFRKFCIVCIIILVITVGITCYCHEEQARAQDSKDPSKLREVLNNIYSAILALPKPIRRVCYVQLFAFLGWFPFLFYATTYIGQVMAQELGRDPDPDLATRKGEFAMLLYSLVGVVAGTILPYLASRDRRLMRHKEDVDDDAEFARIRETVRQWKAEAAVTGKRFKLPRVPLLLRNVWTGALFLFSILTFSTFFIKTVAQATAFISLVGICWSVAMWVPFAIIMELLKEPPASSRPISKRPEPRRLSTGNGERRPLLRRRTTGGSNTSNEVTDTSPPELAGGTILGVHNLAIVMPQFLVSLVTNIIFRTVDGANDNNPADHSIYYGKNGVAWVLRFGGLCTIFAALLARCVPPTPTEKSMRRRRAEMVEAQDEV